MHLDKCTANFCSRFRLTRYKLNFNISEVERHGLYSLTIRGRLLNFPHLSFCILLTYYFHARPEYVANIPYFIHERVGYVYITYLIEQIDGVPRSVLTLPVYAVEVFPCGCRVSSRIKLFPLISSSSYRCSRGRFFSTIEICYRTRWKVFEKSAYSPATQLVIYTSPARTESCTIGGRNTSEDRKNSNVPSWTPNFLCQT